MKTVTGSSHRKIVGWNTGSRSESQVQSLKESWWLPRCWFLGMKYHTFFLMANVVLCSLTLILLLALNVTSEVLSLSLTLSSLSLSYTHIHLNEACIKIPIQFQGFYHSTDTQILKLKNNTLHMQNLYRIINCLNCLMKHYQITFFFFLRSGLSGISIALFFCRFWVMTNMQHCGKVFRYVHRHACACPAGGTVLRKALRPTMQGANKGTINV